MLSTKPYLIDALYKWIIDNGWTPHLLVATHYPNSQLPKAFLKEDQVTLNISPNAVRDLIIDQQVVKFTASFAGVVHFVVIPTIAAIGIFAKENQKGMFFNEEEFNAPDFSQHLELSASSNSIDHSALETAHSKKVTHLKLVKKPPNDLTN